MSKRVVFRRLLRSAFFMIGFTIILVMLVLVIFAPLIVQFDPNENSLTKRLQPPEWFSRGLKSHVLGTDNMGRDVFTRLLIGGRYSLAIAFTVVAIASVTGTILGLIAGYYGGIADTIIMRLCDILISIPALISAIAVMAVLGANTFNLVVVIIITSWIQYTKVGRNNVLMLKNMEFVHAAKVIGASNRRIMFKEIFPNITTPLLIQISQAVGSAIIVESSLSFLNLGIQPPTPSWGNMISTGRSYLATHPWMVFAPGIALMLTILAFNFLGDGLRDVFDPKRN